MAKTSVWDGTDEPSAENPDKDIIQTVIASENERVSAEATRISNENARKTAETARATAEAKRITDEEARQQNEAGREAAERIRQEGFSTWQDEWGKISSFDKRIENLEAAVAPGLVTPVVDSEVAYSKTVPTGALPNAAVTEVGGMSYRCENLAKPNITLQWLSTATIADDGKITITCNAVGTAFCIAYKATVKAGESYYVKLHNANGISRVVLFKDATASAGSLTGFSMEGVYTAKSDITIYIGVYLHDNVTSGTVGSCYVMLNKGTSALPYQPYFEGLRDSKVTEVASVGANLILFPYAEMSKTLNGLTFTSKEDGGITVSGKLTGYPSETNFFLIKPSVPITLPNGKYTMSQKMTTSGMHVLLALVNKTTGATTYRGAGTFEITDGIGLWICVQPDSDTTDVSTTIYPMLNKGSTALPYSPYFRKTLTMPADALDGFGQGVSKDYCNKIVLDPLEGVKKYVKMVGEVDMGTLNWSIEENRYAFSTVVVARKNASIVYSHLITGLTNIYVNNYGNIVVNFETGAYTSSSALKTALSGVIVAYELANSTETDISPYFNDDNLLPVEAGGTVTAVNEYEQAVPFSIEYTLKGA